MIHAYDKLYLEKARTALGRMLDFAVYDLGREIDSFFGMFLASGVAARFETGDCAVLVGMSGVELAYEVLEQSGVQTKRVKPNYTANRSREYWTGWALAYYQWETSLRFAEIVEYIPLRDVMELYEYFTRVMYVSSATSTWIDDYKTKVYSKNAPEGTIFVAENNSPLETVEENGATCYKVDTSTIRNTQLNGNGVECYGSFKVCIPVDNVTNEGRFTIKATGGVAQYNLFLAKNSSNRQQSSIIADPAYMVLYHKT